MQHHILILGGGNMGGAMARRLHAQGHRVTVVERDATRRTALLAQGIACSDTLVPSDAEAVILAIKPQQFAALVPDLKHVLAEHAPLILSIMAGVPLAALHVLGARVLRAMPNLPAVMGESMSVLCAPGLDAHHRAVAEHIFSAIGKVGWVEEEEALHVVTAISGSGPGYVFAFMEALENAAVQHGLNAEMARLLVTQTLRGAALLADHAHEDASALRAQVTSKGGTTEAALAVLAEGGFAALIKSAVDAAANRSHTLSK